jgi:type I restriction enzyme S subunit
MSNESPWLPIQLGDLVHGIRGVSYQPSDLMDAVTASSVVLLRANNIQAGRLLYHDIQIVPRKIVKKEQLITNGDIAVCMSNGSKRLVGKSSQYNGEFNAAVTVGAFCSVFRVKEGAVPEFVKQLFHSGGYQAFIDVSLAGSAINNLKNSDIESMKFLVPGQPVQKKISSILQTIDQTIEKTEALIEKYQQIKAGLMHDLFTRGIGADGNLRPPREQAPELYQQTPIGWIPKEWGYGFLENLLAPVANNLRSGPFGSALLKSELVKDGIPFLGIDNVHVERFEESFRRFVSEKKYSELRKYAVRPKDVVITIMGTVGRAAVIPEHISLALSSKHLWTMTFDQSLVIPELICWQLNYASWVKTWFRRETQGGIMDAIQSKTLRTLILPIPSSAEQELIFARYKAITSKIEAERKGLEKRIKEKSGLMHDLLTGEKQVTIDQPEAAYV